MHATAHILDEPSVRGAALPISVAQYHRLSADGIVPERTELLQGVIIEQMTKSPLHTFIVQRLAGWLAAAVPAGWFVRKEEPRVLPWRYGEGVVSFSRRTANTSSAASGSRSESGTVATAIESPRALNTSMTPPSSPPVG